MPDLMLIGRCNMNNFDFPIHKTSLLIQRHSNNKKCDINKRERERERTSAPLRHVCVIRLQSQDGGALEKSVYGASPQLYPLSGWWPVCASADKRIQK